MIYERFCRRLSYAGRGQGIHASYSTTLIRLRPNRSDPRQTEESKEAITRDLRRAVRTVIASIVGALAYEQIAEAGAGAEAEAKAASLFMARVLFITEPATKELRVRSPSQTELVPHVFCRGQNLSNGLCLTTEPVFKGL